MEKRLKIFVDIDGTICDTGGLDYREAKPRWDCIDRLNRLYDKGHVITLYTARGSETGIDWGEVTEKQLKSWNVRYSALKLGKPAWDLYIGDKAVNAEDWRRMPS